MLPDVAGRAICPIDVRDQLVGKWWSPVEKDEMFRWHQLFYLTVGGRRDDLEREAVATAKQTLNDSQGVDALSDERIAEAEATENELRLHCLLGDYLYAAPTSGTL